MIAKPKPSKKRHKLTDACDISPAVRKAVGERDNHQSIISGETYNLEMAHYIGRSQCGLGIEENLVLLTKKEHLAYDSGDKQKEYGEIIREYLQSYYPNWNEKNLIYNKFKFIDPAYAFDNSVK